jgi:hypothetical protein
VLWKEDILYASIIAQFSQPSLLFFAPSCFSAADY